MTNEEAIEILKDMIEFGWGFSDNEKSKSISACEMAIEALEQEPKEITIDDVQKYCKQRCLTVITNELLYDLTHITCRNCGTFLLEKDGQMICPTCGRIKQEESEDKE